MNALLPGQASISPAILPMRRSTRKVGSETMVAIRNGTRYAVSIFEPHEMLDMASTRNVAIFVFDDVEVLDMCGPFEVFSVSGRDRDPKPFHAYLVAEEKRPIIARHGLSVNPHHDFTDCPPPDILLLPGGYGTRREMHNRAVIDWVNRLAPRAELVTSVCTGALLLAKGGLLDGLEATTHHLALDLLRLSAPHTVVRTDRRYIDNGKIITSGGIAAGIDMALHIVSRLHGEAMARDAAEYMEYPWQPITPG